MDPIMDKTEAGRLVEAARVRAGLSWEDVAAKIDAPLVWTVAALLGQHPVPADKADAACTVLGLDGELGVKVAESLRQQPSRSLDPALWEDPTIYRLREALMVYGPALKALIHEEFGDGIMSAINFKVDFDRRSDPDGDRVVITLDGKFLDYRW